MEEAQDVIVSGVGVISHLGSGIPAAPAAAVAQRRGDIADFGFADDYRYLALTPPDYEELIPKRADRKLMADQFLFGCYAAGLALRDAGLLGDEKLLRTTGLYVASDSPDRDAEIDAKILAANMEAQGTMPMARVNEIFMTELRPTAFLCRIPNLLAGNISIVFGVTGTSRTFSGCETGGATALARACDALRAGVCERVLIGGALNGARVELLRWLYAAGEGLKGDFSSPWSEHRQGMCLGSAGAFLVLETRQSAEERGHVPRWSLRSFGGQRSNRDNHEEVLAALVRSARQAGLAADACVVTNTSGGGLSDVEKRFWRAHAGDGTPVVSSAGLTGSCFEADVFLQVALGIGVLSGAAILDNRDACATAPAPAAAPDAALVVCSGMKGGASAFGLARL